MKELTRNEAFKLLKEYNNENFHIRHALTVEGVMKYFAEKLGYGDEKEFWGTVGLLHDLDFEKYPEEHCIKSQEIMKEREIDERIIRATASHCYGINVDIKPEHKMEKILYATDELTGLIGAVALMRPSKSVQDMEVKSVKKKFKDKKFAAGCSRDIILKGAEMLGWELDKLIEETILAMRVDEESINKYMESVGKKYMNEIEKSEDYGGNTEESVYKKKRYLVKVAVFLILTRKKGDKTEVLLQRRFNTGYMDGKYDTACSGHLEEGEELSNAIIREAKEELGIYIKEKDLKFVALIHPYKDGYLNVFFKADTYTGNPTIMEPDKCDDLQWFNLDNLPKDTVPLYAKIMKNIDKEPFYDNGELLKF